MKYTACSERLLFHRWDATSLRLFLRIALRIPAAHDFRVICARSGPCIYNICEMVAFSKRLGLREANHCFFLENEYRDLTIFLLSLNAAITFVLYSEYRTISTAE